MENKVISTEYVKKNFIEKDKIREKIEELKSYENYIPLINKYSYYELMKHSEDILQELMEETDDQI